MTQPNNPDRESRNREFVRLLAEHERRLAGYVHILVPAWQDAEDVLQSTKLWLWEQFDSFQLGTDFAAWAIAATVFSSVAHARSFEQPSGRNNSHAASIRFHALAA